MLVVLEKNASKKNIEDIVRHVQDMGLRAELIPGSTRTAIGILGNTGYVGADTLVHFAGVKEIIHVSKSYKLASREYKTDDTIVDVDGVKVGGKNFTVIAGPCSVESEDQIVETAKAVKKAGAHMLRGGAFKPRTGPYAFRGLGEEGLKLLKKAKEETGLPIVTECVHVRHLDLVCQYADLVQIGARNMQNFEMLEALGKIKKPILLKRGLSAKVEELLLAAEYILDGGNPDVILCERGIRSFDPMTRNVLDLNVIPLIKKLSHLPIITDPSHGTGRYDLVTPLAKASRAVGAHGIIVEVHPDPKKALSDGDQSLNFESFEKLMRELNAMKV